SGRVAERNVDFFPGNAHHLGRDSLAIGPGFSPEVADPGLDVHPAVRLDDEEAVEADGSGVVRADRHAAAAHLRALALSASGLSLIPLEKLRAPVECLFHKAAGRIGPVALRVRRTEFGFSARRVELPDLDLIDAELARRFRHDRLHQYDALHA